VRQIVDANIVFSGILNTNSKIGDLLINLKRYFHYIATDFLRSKKKHYPKLIKISGLTLEQIQEAEFQIYKDIHFISKEQIKASSWIVAEKLVADIEPKDIHYIAYAKHFKCNIRSGDKLLIKGLAQKGFTNFITT